MIDSSDREILKIMMVAPFHKAVIFYFWCHLSFGVTWEKPLKSLGISVSPVS